MNNLGIKIVGAEMEVGFTASTREDFESFIARLRWMADTVWPPDAPISDLDTGRASASVGGGYAQERAAAQQFGLEYARRKDAAEYVRDKMAEWREKQGL